MNARVKRKSLTFMVFLAISTSLWFLIKLSKDYSSQTTFVVQFEDVPSDKWIATPSQSVKLSFQADGFRTLAHNLIREQRRTVSISLNEVPYRHEGNITYSFSSNYVAERIAERLKIDATDITMNDATIYFNMDMLKSKVVPVTLNEDIRLQRQHERYGLPVITPAYVTVFGTDVALSEIQTIETELLYKENVSQSFTETIELALPNKDVRCDVKQVEVSIEVEKITEKELEVTISPIDSLDIRFLPPQIKVKCLVAIKDYADITTESFRATVNTDDIAKRKPILPITIMASDNIQVISYTPDRVEYMIIK